MTHERRSCRPWPTRVGSLHILSTSDKRGTCTPLGTGKGVVPSWPKGLGISRTVSSVASRIMIYPAAVISLHELGSKNLRHITTYGTSEELHRRQQGPYWGWDNLRTPMTRYNQQRNSYEMKEVSQDHDPDRWQRWSVPRLLPGYLGKDPGNRE